MKLPSYRQVIATKDCMLKAGPWCDAAQALWLRERLEEVDVLGVRACDLLVKEKPPKLTPCMENYMTLAKRLLAFNGTAL